MTYRTDREVIQDLLPIRLFGAVIVHGIDNPESDEAKQLMLMLKQAETEAVSGFEIHKGHALIRRAWRLHDVIIKPFQDRKESVAKFGLIVFHMLDHIRQEGMLNFPEGGPLDLAISAILSEEGTLNELANVPKVDESALKQAKKMFAVVQREGYFRGASWE